MATYEFYLKTVENGKIDLRKKIQAKYGLNCLNWNNGKIGENLLLELFCNKTNSNPYEVKKMRSNRLKIALKDCIPNNISFNSLEFNNLLNFFKKQEVNADNLKKVLDYNLVYKGIQYFYGAGGIHGVIKPGIYESDNQYIIKSCDVAL